MARGFSSNTTVDLPDLSARAKALPLKADNVFLV
jgi:hypothetical protein